MKGYQNIIGKTQMLQYNKCYNIIGKTQMLQYIGKTQMLQYNVTI